MKAFLAALGAAIVFCGAAGAQTLTPIYLTGDPETRINYVIMADGFTADEMDAFAEAAEYFRDLLLGSSPYVRYLRHFNIYRMDLVSNESGVSRPGNPRDTALRSELGCFGIDRLLCANGSRAGQALAAFPYIRFDIRLIVVNTTDYGGGGGFYATTTLHPAAPSVFQHEIGHSFAFLNDEYVDPNICAQQPGLYGPPGERNATAQTTREASPWALWIDPQTPVPTTAPLDAVPGMYEGAHYCPTGVFRPTFNSLMRSLNRPMEQINTEHFVLRFNDIGLGIDGVNPAPGAAAMPRDGRIRFTVIPKTIDGAAFGVTWRVDGDIVQQPAQGDAPQADGIGFSADGTAYVFRGADWPPGVYQVTATVTDATELVRNDPTGRTSRTVSWTVTVEDRQTPPARLVSSVLPYARSVASPGAATAFASVINAGSELAEACTLQIARGPAGAPGPVDYRATDPATNTAIGPDNPEFDIPAGGLATFVFGGDFTALGSDQALDLRLIADCANSDPAAQMPGVNSVLWTFTPGAAPDIVSIAATSPDAGVVNLPSNGARGAVALAAVNIGAAGDVVLRADLGAGNLPLEPEICGTDPATGVCVTPRMAELPVSFGAGEVRTFAVFLRAHGPVQFAPERYRVFFLFEDANRVARGGASVAARTRE
ncbi:MAG: hypothetical protein KIS81_04415 [Maricaulaceae bacterium]|nr:hypothetical protein [Maricaulaceae bacterium]